MAQEPRALCRMQSKILCWEVMSYLEVSFWRQIHHFKANRIILFLTLLIGNFLKFKLG